MLKSPSSEPSGALVKSKKTNVPVSAFQKQLFQYQRFKNNWFQKQRKQKRCVKLAETAEKHQLCKK